MKPKPKKKDFKALYNSTIFGRVYKKNMWGGKRGEFFSGPGSHNSSIKGYTDMVAKFVRDNNVETIVEIGCGDFKVTTAILKNLDDAKYEYHYIGYDVVKPLIAHNKSLYGSKKVDFICKDSCVGKIKSGDLLIIRQVLQHLNNKSIKQIIEKFANYKYILFTEHQASDIYGDTITPNQDQATGRGIRLRFGSGVYLEKPPFDCKIEAKVYSFMQWAYDIEAFINTYLIKN